MVKEYAAGLYFVANLFLICRFDSRRVTQPTLKPDLCLPNMTGTAHGSCLEGVLGHLNCHFWFPPKNGIIKTHIEGILRVLKTPSRCYQSRGSIAFGGLSAMIYLSMGLGICRVVGTEPPWMLRHYLYPWVRKI